MWSQQPGTGWIIIEKRQCNVVTTTRYGLDYWVQLKNQTGHCWLLRSITLTNFKQSLAQLLIFRKMAD